MHTLLPMQRRLALFLLLACLPACESQPHDAADYARGSQSMVGIGSGPVTVKSVTAEDNVLVITVDGPENWRGGNPSFMLTAFALDGFCDARASKGYFAEGRKLRIDTLEAGRRLIRGQPVTRCRDAQNRVRGPDAAD
jgi:hypothetical protein